LSTVIPLREAIKNKLHLFFEDIENTVCETICNALDECEGFDVYFDRPEAERRVCEVLGKSLTSVHNDWVRDNFDVTNV
jgi:hypothetical protein